MKTADLSYRLRHPLGNREICDEILLDPQHPMPGWLGVMFQDMSEELTEALGFKPRVPVNGAIISAVDPSGPGAQTRPAARRRAGDDQRRGAA